MLQASMLVIGDEILAGHVRDTNSHWLATRLRRHAVPLTRVHTVGDTYEAIDAALQAELDAPRPRVVVTSGGIGSTPDDLTYEAVAASLGRELVEHPVLTRRLDEAVAWTSGHGFEVTPAFERHLRRMSRVPAGAEVVEHPGWAPAVRVDVDGGSDDGGVTIAILPGVPGQFRAIVETALEPQLLSDRNPPQTTVELTHHYPESILNVAFADVLERHPAVRLGSYPGDPMVVRLTGDADDVEAAAQRIRAELDRVDAHPAGPRLARSWSERLAGPDTEDP